MKINCTIVMNLGFKNECQIEIQNVNKDAKLKIKINVDHHYQD